MSIFICEKCGRLDNSANNNNFWISRSNKILKEPLVTYKDEYFNTHSCCALCCKGLVYSDGSISDKFTGEDKCGTVSSKTYKEILEDGEDLSMVFNYGEIMERDGLNGKQQ